MNDMQILKTLEDLINEVREVVESHSFLRGNEIAHSFSIDTDRTVLEGRICPLEELIDAVSTVKDETPYTVLDDFIISVVARAYNGLSYYFPENQDAFVENSIAKIVGIADRSQNEIDFVDSLPYKWKSSDSKVSFLSHIRVTVSGHIAAIIQARVLTLSRRFAPTELLLKAYKFGYYPFGRSDGDGSPPTLLCYNPER
ncbi:MAG: hypothetical protein ACRC46_07335 [Thermoguttaceae bacterium]